MVRRKERETGACPRCNESKSNIHIVMCKGPGTEATFLAAMETVQDWLDQGPSQFALAIIELIHSHRNQVQPRWHLIDSHETQQIVQ